MYYRAAVAPNTANRSGTEHNPLPDQRFKPQLLLRCRGPCTLSLRHSVPPRNMQKVDFVQFQPPRTPQCSRAPFSAVYIHQASQLFQGKPLCLNTCSQSNESTRGMRLPHGMQKAQACYQRRWRKKRVNFPKRIFSLSIV